MPVDGPVLSARDLSKTFTNAGRSLTVLDGVSFDVPAGSTCAIVGPSGSGKTTLLGLCAGLDRPTHGEVHLAGAAITTLPDDALADLRSATAGFIFQAFNLIPRMSAATNVELPLMYRGVRRSERRRRALDALAKVGLADRSHHQPNELSGGQQQRVAVARALAMEPSLMLADEPTGNLDSRSTADGLDLLDEIHAEGKTIVIITHEDDVAERAGRVVTLRDGKVESDVLAAAR